MFKRLLITAASTAALGLVPVSCGDSGAGSDKPLRWRTAVDVPVNFSMPVGDDLNYAELLPDVDCDELTDEYPELFILKPCEDYSTKELLDMLSQLDPDNPKPDLPSSYVFDVGSNTISTKSDVIDVLRKLTDTKIQYSITAANNTKAPLTFYGMFFRADDTAAMKCPVDTFYNAVINDSVRGGRVNMFGPSGLHLPKDSTGRYPLIVPPDTLTLSDTSQGRRLGDLIIRQKAFSYRWLVKIDDISNLGSTSENSDSIAIKLRIRFSGINSIDSLFTL